MGKRRERRIAALMASGRRVKLDLFTEPSGELVGTSRHDEGGGDLDLNSHARAPNSPSSPGQQQENPLLLLGQYSDDELEEEENEQLKPSVEVEELVDIERDKDSDEGKDVASPEIKQDNVDGDLDPLNAVKYMDDNDSGASDFTALSKPCSEADSMAEVSFSGISGQQIDQDATGEWKIVMHEESNRYYYWNTVTGETSWEVPDMLAERMEAPGEKKLSPIIEEGGSVLLDAHASGLNLNADLEVYENASSFNGPMQADLIAGVKEHCESDLELEMGNVGAKGENSQVLNDNPSAISVPKMEASALVDSVSNQQSNMVCCGIGGSTSTSNDLPVAINVKEKKEHPTVSKECAEVGHYHSAQLMTLGENLLQRLKVLEGFLFITVSDALARAGASRRPHTNLAFDLSGEQTQALDWWSKYISEIEIRLSDCKALACYGSSLLPFWWHTEMKLKQLELAIGEAVSRSARHEFLNKVETLQTSVSRDGDTSQQSMEAASGVGGKDKVLLSSPVENAYVSTDIDDASEIVKNQVDQFVLHDVETEYGLSSAFMGSESGEIAQKADENLVPVSLVHITAPHAGEAADMDVDMEVDNETPADHAISLDASPSFQLEKPIHSNTNLPSLDCTTLEPVEDFIAPPPPDEDWIPPPPPDNEPVPPPPPDEPPAPFYPLPPPYAESTPPLPYVEQYNFGYSVPSYEYYASAVTEVTSATYYAPTESCQNVESQPPPYYELAAKVFTEATPVVVNTVTSVVYYDLPNGAVPSEPVVNINSLESSSFYSESGSVSCHDNVASDYAGSIGVVPESGYAQVPSQRIESNLSTSSSEIEVVTVQCASYTTGASVVNESVADPLPTADAKNPPKVVRNKKRTIAVAPTLRSNRKVSSLVDKWKAAKEELHGDEDDEPEDAYEVLEKKRRKQIEEWRSQQIASGEARDNANFQPLGGDWRERVKRKKAESSGKAVQNSSEEAVNERQQPNLIELSKDIPSGWQAYWDESSKQVYYGNAVTAETTWIRPTS